MLYTIQNELLSVSADDHGAELNSVFCGGTEYLWQGDPKWWVGHAPILFPVIGTLRGASYLHCGKKYILSQNHGFARHSRFNTVSKTDGAITFSLFDNEETREVYPFQFELLISYTLSGSSLRTDFKITNKSATDMYFSVGGHPAFNCPLFKDETFEDYEIVFNENETAGVHIVTDRLVLDEKLPFFNNSNRISLTHELFRKYQTLVFSDLKSTSVTLRSQKTGMGVTLSFKGFPYFGIWQPPGAPFICLEPWQGIDDSPDSSENLCDKKGIMRLAPNSFHTCGFVLDTGTSGILR